MRPAKRRFETGQILLAIPAFFFCAVLAGCIGVTPMPKRTRTPEGAEVKTVDLSFIQPGHTTRAEVKEKLKLIDTGYESERYFLGRWSSSSVGGWAFVIGMGGGTGNASRLWTSGNLLVEFDDEGVVRGYRTFPDKRMIQELAPVAAITTPTPDRQQLEVKYLKGQYKRVVSARIVLTANAFDFEELGDTQKAEKFTLSAGDVLTVTTSIGEQDPDPVYNMHTVHFARNLKPLGGPRDKKIELELKTPELVRLLSFIAHSRAPESIPAR